MTLTAGALSGNSGRTPQWTDARRAYVDSLAQDVRLLLAAIEKFRVLGATTKNAALKESVAQTSLLLEAGTVRELLAVLCEIGHPGLEKKIAYGCVFYDLIAQLQAQIWAVAEIRSRCLNDMLVQAGSSLAHPESHAGPVSAGLAHSYAATHSSLATLRQSGRQWTAMMERNIAAMTFASVQLSRTAKQKLAGALRGAH